MGQSASKAAVKAVQTGGKRPGENGFKYRAQFGLVLVCSDEAHQQKLFNKLTKQGLKPRVVSV